MQTPSGERGSQVRYESLSDLYYFFEQSIVAVTMSFQALELFANAIIGRQATGEIIVKRKAGVEKRVNPAEAEREFSTEEKFGQVLPGLLKVPSPLGNRVWQTFKTLKSARDATVHLKSTDMFTRNQIDRESLFFHFLNTDAREHPGAAIKVISHYYPHGLPRWLRYAKEAADRDSSFGMSGSPL